MYERRHEELVPRSIFYRRLARQGGIAFALVLAALGIGISGYHFIENLPWVDALLNASMILGGMGPVAELKTAAGKLFASFYALFSGLAFITIAGVLFVPVAHRFLHKFHLDSETGRSSSRHREPPRTAKDTD